MVSHEYDEPDEYVVQLVSGSADCQDVAYDTVLVKEKTTTGIEEQDEQTSIYGFKNQVFIDFHGNAPDDATVTIYNQLGQKVVTTQEISGNNDKMIIEVDVPSGVYVVKIRNQEGDVRTKLVHLNRINE